MTKICNGQVFVKYGRYGKPHLKKVWLTDDYSEIRWQDPDGKTACRALPMAEVTDVVIGHAASDVLRRAQIPKSKDTLCFSLHASK